MSESTAGTRFARAFADKDFDAVTALVSPELDFRALTLRREWEAADGPSLKTGVLERWLEPDDEVEALERVETDTVVDRERVGYRLRVRNPDGLHTVEQQAYLTTDADGRIDWMRVICSGFRPID